MKSAMEQSIKEKIKVLAKRIYLCREIRNSGFSKRIEHSYKGFS